MTLIKITRNKQGQIVSVSLDGHTDYGEEGEDIVCAGISTLAQTAALGLLSVAQVNIKFARGESNIPYFAFTLPNDLTQSQRHDSDVILNTMMLGMRDLCEGYSKYIKLEDK